MSGTLSRRSRLAQRWRHFVGSTSPTLPIATAPAPLPHLHHLDAPRIDHYFWDEVLQLLNPEQQTVVRQYTCSELPDITLKLDGAYAAATEKRLQCEAKRWTYDFGGKTIRLSDAIDSVVSCLNRFKAVGDVAVNADPVHAGLPWAGIRLLLEVCLLYISSRDLRLITDNLYTGGGVRAPSDGGTCPWPSYLSLHRESTKGLF